MQYPALYISADDASKSVKSAYFLFLKLNGFLLIIGAALSLYGIESTLSAILAAIIFLCTVFVSVYFSTKNFERSWYKARALAESVKTISWRYAMGAEPFLIVSNNMQNVDVNFRNRMRQILDENRDLGEFLVSEASTADQITEEMRHIRSSSLKERIEIYRNKRIINQRIWYSKEAKRNKNSHLRYFMALVLLQGIAILMVIFRIAYPNFHYWPTEVFIVSASFVMTWMQSKRFRELAAAYTLAAHEIGIINSSLDQIDDDRDFSNFVKDSENAFSREHTQWAARKD